MRGKIIPLIIIVLMIFGSIGVTGLNNVNKKNKIYDPLQYIKNKEVIVEDEPDCSNCEFNGYHFGLLGRPNTLFKSEKLVELSSDPPKSWDWRNATYNDKQGNWVTSVKDQGECGSCATFGSIGCFESAYKIYKSDPNIDIDFSEQFLVSCGKEWVGDKNIFVRMRGCSGSTILGVLEFIKQYGVINETCFPYTSGISGDEPPCSDKCESWKEQRIRAKDYKLVMGDVITKNGFNAGWDNTKVKLALINYGPLAAPMFVFEDFLNYTGGVYELNRSEKWFQLGFHLVLIVGYQDDPSFNTGGYWICKNSWGTEWGDNGYFKIKYEDFFNWMYEEYLGRLINIRSLGDLIEFFKWISGWGFGIPVVGIGYIPSGFFTGVTKNIVESGNQKESPLKNFDLLNKLERREILLSIIKLFNKIQNIIRIQNYN